MGQETRIETELEKEKATKRIPKVSPEKEKEPGASTTPEKVCDWGKQIEALKDEPAV